MVDISVDPCTVQSLGVPLDEDLSWFLLYPWSASLVCLSRTIAYRCEVLPASEMVTIGRERQACRKVSVTESKDLLIPVERKR